MSSLKELLSSLVPFSLKTAIVAVTVVIVVLFSGLIIFSLSRNAVNYYPQEFSVQGTAKEKVSPDSMTLELGKVMRGSDPAKLQSDANTALNKLQNELISAGLNEKEIRTNGYNLSPVYNDKSEITGYSITIGVVITKEGIDFKSELVQKILTAGQNSGVNEVRNLNFYLKDQEQLAQDLEKRAVDNAKELAQKRAQESGLRLGAIKNVIYNGGYLPYYGGTMMSVENSRASDAATPISAPQPSGIVTPGEFDLETNVTVIYEVL